MIQSSAMPHGAYQLAGGQGVTRRPTIGAPEVVLTEQPAANLKRRSHIRRTSRSGNSPSSPERHESQPPSTTFRRSRRELPPLITAFTRSVTTSVSSGSILSRQHTLMEHSGIEWRNSPQYQPKVVSGAETSRRSTIASVYSLPSAAPHESRRPTQENFILDWSVIDRALQSRAESQVISPHCTQPLQESSRWSSQTHAQCSGSRTQIIPNSLSRSNTTQRVNLEKGTRVQIEKQSVQDKARLPDQPLLPLLVARLYFEVKEWPRSQIKILTIYRHQHWWPIPLRAYSSEKLGSRDDSSQYWAGSLTLLDTLETYFDARIDLIERKFRHHSDRLKRQARFALKRTTSEALKRTKTPGSTGDLTRLYDERSKEIEVELEKIKKKFQKRMSTVQEAWESATVVRTREKVSFFYGVMMVLASALLFGLAPEWLHVVYSVHVAYFLPTRFYVYKKKHWHYFLFDLCYYAQILCLVYIWWAPSNTTLWVAAYLLSHGSLASAVITWRNSLVFHDLDKVISLFIHIYPPLVFTVIRHFYPKVEDRFPAAAKVQYLEPIQSLVLSTIIYLIWQTLYWKFVLVDRRKKIESGQRTTSFSFLLNEKRGVIGKTLGAMPPQRRELAFMLGQLVYSVLTCLPAIFLLYTSPKWSGAFLLLIFSVSVWNGGGFYIEVFGRKFERELEALRKELAEATAAGSTTPQSQDTTMSRPHPSISASSDPGESSSSSASNSPLVVGRHGPNVHVEELSLDSKDDQRKNQ
ncbi:hypothetical protein OPQ81_009770 [Rhizoctonia solani]|nr:hypothetical protein OPQ81_009770 [Rhizoctonia solani]